MGDIPPIAELTDEKLRELAAQPAGLDFDRDLARIAALPPPTRRTPCQTGRAIPLSRHPMRLAHALAGTSTARVV
jgi:hypothetical protein